MGKMERARRRRRQRQSALSPGGTTRQFQARVRRETSRTGGGREILVPPTESLGLPKMSERVLELADPLLAEVRTLSNVRSAVAAAATAWNLAVSRKLGLKAPLGSLFSGSGLSFLQRLVLRRVIKNLARRKDELYRDDDRMIVDWDVSMRQSGPHVQVATAVYLEQLAPQVRERLAL